MFRDGVKSTSAEALEWKGNHTSDSKSQREAMFTKSTEFNVFASMKDGGGGSNSYSHSDQVAQNKEGQEFLLDKLKTKIRPTSLFFNLDPFFFF